MTLLRSATLTGGSLADVRLDGERIAEVGPAGSLSDAEGEVIDLSGSLLLPAPAEIHAHLDKAYLAERVPNPTGDLYGAIEAMLAYRPALAGEDILQRARRAALTLVAHGATAIRTHVDVGEGIELRGLEALRRLQDELEGLVHLETVALVGRPITGVDGATNRSLLRAALEMGADLSGGAPHSDPDPPAALEFCVATAAEFGRAMDLHMDETLDPGATGLVQLARMVAEGFPHPVTASHCVSLGVQPAEVQAEWARAVAEAGIAVVACPQTNLYLQARGRPSSPPRGLTAVRALMEAGATVAGGGDNTQDPFNPMGRADPLETAALLVVTAHLTPEEAYGAVSARARSAMGLPEVRVEPGSPADLLAISAGSIREALATGTPDRVVIGRGRVLATTRVDRHVSLGGGIGAGVGGREASWR
jgi:cytosine/creatinine deaminase